MFASAYPERTRSPSEPASRAPRSSGPAATHLITITATNASGRASGRHITFTRVKK
jgi:hypothetical protein